MWFLSKVFIGFCWKTNNFQGTKLFSLLNQTKPIWNEYASDQVAIGLSSSRSWIVCEDGAGFVDWLVTERNDGKTQLNSTSKRVNPHLLPLFLSKFFSLDRQLTTTVFSRMEFSSTSQTREPCTKIEHPGLKRLTILCNQARRTLTGGLCPWKWVQVRVTLNASHGCTTPVWILSKTLILVSVYWVLWIWDKWTSTVFSEFWTCLQMSQ